MIILKVLTFAVLMVLLRSTVKKLREDLRGLSSKGGMHGS